MELGVHGRFLGRAGTRLSHQGEEAGSWTNADSIKVKHSHGREMPCVKLDWILAWETTR